MTVQAREITLGVKVQHAILASHPERVLVLKWGEVFSRLCYYGPTEYFGEVYKVREYSDLVAAFSPDGLLCVIVISTKAPDCPVVKVFDTRGMFAEKDAFLLPPHRTPSSVAIMNDGTVACGDLNGIVEVFTSGGEKLGELRPFNLSVRHLSVWGGTFVASTGRELVQIHIEDPE